MTWIERHDTVISTCASSTAQYSAHNNTTLLLVHARPIWHKDINRTIWNWSENTPIVWHNILKKITWHHYDLLYTQFVCRKVLDWKTWDCYQCMRNSYANTTMIWTKTHATVISTCAVSTAQYSADNNTTLLLVHVPLIWYKVLNRTIWHLSVNAPLE